jgi:hypothetical protein
MNEDIDVINTFWSDIAFAITDYIDDDVKAGEVTVEMIKETLSSVADEVAPITLGYDDVTVEDMQNSLDGIPTEDEVYTFMRMTEEDRAKELYTVFEENIDYITDKYNQYLKEWEDTMGIIAGSNQK